MQLDFDDEILVEYWKLREEHGLDWKTAGECSHPRYPERSLSSFKTAETGRLETAAAAYILASRQSAQFPV